MRITVDQQLPINVNPLTSKGRGAVIDGTVRFVSSDSTVATVVSTGAQTALVKPTGKVGVVKITAAFDADLGEGVRNITTTSDPIDIVEAEAVSGVIEFGTPTGGEEPEEPAPTPPVPTPVPEPTLEPWEQPLTLSNVPAGTTVPKLLIGKAKANVRDFGALGDNKANDIAAFIAAVKSLPADGGTLIIPDGEYMLPADEKTWLRSNLRIYWAKNAWINTIPHNDDRAYPVNVLDHIHVELYNPQVRGERLKHTFTTFPPIVKQNPDGTTTTTPSSRDTHEWGHNIAVRGKSDMINILFGNSREANGDGISCGGTNLFIYGFVTQANRRQGITLGSAKNVKVYNCDMLDTGDYETSEGTNPQAGIDIEPDAPNDSKNVHVYGCRSLGNRVGVEVFGNNTPINGDYAEIIGLVVEQTELGRNVIGCSLTGVKGAVLRDLNVHDNETLGIQTVARVSDLTLDNITYHNNSTRLGPQKVRNFKLAGTSTLAATNTTRDILLKGSPVNTMFPTESTFN